MQKPSFQHCVESTNNFHVTAYILTLFIALKCGKTLFPINCCNLIRSHTCVLAQNIFDISHMRLYNLSRVLKTQGDIPYEKNISTK